MYNSSLLFSIFFLCRMSGTSSVKPENYEVADENEEAYLPCGKLTVHVDDTVMWYKDSQLVLDMFGDRARVDINGSLIIKPVKRGDLGFYDCKVDTQRYGDKVLITKTMFLNVRYLPVIVNIIDKLTVHVGEVVQLPCAATGNPGVDLVWRLPNGDNVKTTDKFKVVSNGSLIIHNVGVSDAKNYTCSPSNDLGPGKERQTEVIVHAPPEFFYPAKKEQEVLEGSNITLDCASSGIPKPTIRWGHDNQKVKNGGRFRMESIGTLTITNVKAKDAGMYDCVVKSIAGHQSRSMKLIVKGKPGKPKMLEVSILKGTVFMKWQRSYDGGSKQHFQVWTRTGRQSEFAWKTSQDIESKVDESSEGKNFPLTSLFGNMKAGEKVNYLFSVRAINERGASAFSDVVKVVSITGSTSDKATGRRVEYLHSKPFAPYNVTVNMTTKGYVLTWKEKVVPGRPPAKRIIVRYRQKESTHPWKHYAVPLTKQARRKRRSNNDPNAGLTLTPAQLKVDNFLDLIFRVVSESADGTLSTSEEPTFIVSGKPPHQVPASNPDDEGKIAPIVLGAIFGAFGILLLVSIYCFCKKRKNQRYPAAKKDQIAFTKENGVHLDDAMEAGYGDDEEDGDDAKLLTSSDEQDSPRRYHLQTCPALKLGEYSNSGNSGKNKDPVYFLLQRYEEEKELCTCSNMRFMTLASHEQRVKREKKKQQRANGNGIYKSNSSPSLTSENGSSIIDPAQLLDEEGYDISDNENDLVSELKTEQQHTLKRKKFMDSYDQFCSDGGTRQRLSSEEKTEVDKNLESVGMKDINDVSSENSATESERVITPKVIAEKEDNRRSKSSGYGDGSNTTSDSESVQEVKTSARLPPYTSGYMTDNMVYRPRDHGYASDISTRSSPLDYKGNRSRYQPPSSQRQPPRIGYDPLAHHYISEDESVRSSHSGVRPIQPPPYTQALHDIERFSEKNDVTDSEDMYDHLIDMGKQLGVSLDDSIESDLNTKGMVQSTFPNPPVESGYLTDTSIGKERYTDREKSERCAQLLSEFKSSKSRNTINNNTDTEMYDNETPVEPAVRSRSVMGNVTDFEEPRVPPVLRRSNSAGASGVYKEWLV